MSLAFAVALLLSPPQGPASLGPACIPDRDRAFAKPQAEAYIRGAEREWAASFATDEAPVLQRLLAPNVVFALDGRVSDKAAMIARARKRRPGQMSDTLETMDVRFYGPVAIAAGSERWTQTSPHAQGRIVWSDTWVRCQGVWRIVGSMDVSDPGT